MENISEKKFPSLYFHEDNAPPVKDEWARINIIRTRQELDQIGADVRDIKQIIFDQLAQNATISEWRIPPVQSPFLLNTIDVPTNIKTTFEKLEEDFSDFSNRIVWCNELKNYLEKFEEELEEYDAKYLSWFVSTLKDVFSYNYAETITEEQLILLKNGIETIYAKQEDCDKDSFTEYHLKLVESGFSLLPTSQKAIDEFGE